MKQTVLRLIHLLMGLSIAAYLATLFMLAVIVWQGASPLRLCYAALVALYSTLVLVLLAWVKRILQLRQGPSSPLR